MTYLLGFLLLVAALAAINSVAKWFGLDVADAAETDGHDSHRAHESHESAAPAHDPSHASGLHR